MKSRIYLITATLMPVTAFANDEELKSVWENLFVACAPILIIVFFGWLFWRTTNKGGKSTSERLLESNLEIAKELKRIADFIEKGK